MGTTHYAKSSTPLIRDPADWARDAGWVSRLRADRAAKRIRDIADGIDFALDCDETGQEWVAELRAVARYLTTRSR